MFPYIFGLAMVLNPKVSLPKQSSFDVNTSKTPYQIESEIKTQGYSLSTNNTPLSVTVSKTYLNWGNLIPGFPTTIPLDIEVLGNETNNLNFKIISDHNLANTSDKEINTKITRSGMNLVFTTTLPKDGIQSVYTNTYLLFFIPGY